MESNGMMEMEVWRLGTMRVPAFALETKLGTLRIGFCNFDSIAPVFPGLFFPDPSREARVALDHEGYECVARKNHL